MQERYQQNAVDSADEAEVANEKYVYHKSCASCKFSELKGFIYGGISSRFWMMRKHIISSFERVEPEFYSWECISLEMENRTIDLVIKDERVMTCFIKLLIHKLNTVDGQANSAIKIEKQLFE